MQKQVTEAFSFLECLGTFELGLLSYTAEMKDARIIN